MAKYTISIEGKPDIFHFARYGESATATGNVSRPVWSFTSSDPYCIPLEGQRANTKKSDLSIKTENK